MDFSASAKVHGQPDDGWRRVHDNLEVDDETPNGGPNHLKAWRLHRKLTQQQLADAVEPPTTKQVIAALESGQNGISAKWLRRLAPALKTRPGYLLDFAPDEVDNEWSEVTDAVPPERRAEAARILKVLADPKS